MSRPAVFLDRDGTIIRDFHFVGKPEQVELMPGAAAAMLRLNVAKLPVILVTNQSGIARGYFTEFDYARVQERLAALLAESGARWDASYMCPHHPDVGGECQCRKPGTLLFSRAAEEHGLDLARSWFVGDKLRDVIPAAAFGGRGVLVPTDETPDRDIEEATRKFAVATSLDAAVDRVVESAR
jgi:D-glycero-D-manno-heptose 1,7-bisphosphate phosphatase